MNLDVGSSPRSRATAAPELPAGGLYCRLLALRCRAGFTKLTEPAVDTRSFERLPRDEPAVDFVDDARVPLDVHARGTACNPVRNAGFAAATPRAGDS